MLACVTNREVDAGASDLLDSRYFFVDREGIGHATCGFSWQVAKGLLLNVFNISDFPDTLWEANLILSGGKNRSVLGFHVECLVLRKIINEGCPAAGPGFEGRGSHSVFGEDLPPPVNDDFEGWRLYIPSAYNFRPVDGILV